VTHLQPIRDIDIAQSLDLSQHQDSLMALRKPAQSLCDRLVLLTDHDRLMRPVHPQRRWRHLFVEQSAGATTLTERVDREVSRDAEQPASKCRGTLQRLYSIDGPGEALLADVLRVFTVGDEMTTKPIKFVRIAAKQDL
jgi:hypothetical protein